MIELKNINKNYKKIRALNNINLSFEKGHIYGMLGNNGAGKSTIVKMVGNLISCSSGEVVFDNLPLFDNENAMNSIAIAGDYCDFLPTKKIEKLLENALFFNENFDFGYAIDLCEKFGLDINQKMNALSTGYETIFKFIMAVSSGKEFIFLDEPILGLDAINRQKVYEVIMEAFSRSECSIIICTHLIDEIANLIDRVVFVKYGDIVYEGDKDELIDRVCVVSGRAEEVEKFIQNKKVINKNNFNGIMTCYVHSDTADKGGCDIALSKGTLQNIFISICS